MREVARLYDELLSFESKWKDQKSYPVHKKLTSKTEAANLLELIASEVQFRGEDHVLDAGCGTGHTLFTLHRRFGLKGEGISLSHAEIEYAGKICEKENMDAFLKFHQESYDTHKGGPYTKVICIESLKHSWNLEKSLKNLLESLSKDGVMTIADDFLDSDVQMPMMLEKFWLSPSFTSKEEIASIISKMGYVCRIKDLTPFVHSRPVWMLNMLYFMSVCVKSLTLGRVKRNIATYMGGLILEKLYAQQKAKYMILIIRNKTRTYGKNKEEKKS